jgi:hypothetical protein
VPSQILPIFYVNIEHIDSKMGEIWVAQANFRPISYSPTGCKALYAR